MKYIDLYLNKRQEELEKEKADIIAKFKEQYKDCITNEDIETLIEDCTCNYNLRIDWINMRLDELEGLRKDLILDKGSDEISK